MGWKAIVRDLNSMFEKNKAGLVIINDNQDPGRQQPVQITPDPHTLTFEGMKMNPKMVRRWLWEQRNTRGVQREGNFIWGAYIEEEDKTMVGLGALTSPTAAVRLAKMREEAA